MLFYLFGFIAFLYIIHLYFNCNKKALLIRKIPGPKDTFILGNALELLVSPVELFRLGRKYAKQWNGIYRFWTFAFGCVNIYNPDDIEIVTSSMKHSKKSNFYNFLKPWLGDGLLLSSGSKWQQRRKILTPTFHFNTLRQFCATFDESARRLVATLDALQGRPVDVVPLVSQLTLHALCETAMGTQLDEVATETGKCYKETIYELGKIFIERFSKAYYHFDLVFNLTTLNRKLKLYVKILRNFTQKVIKDRKDYINEHGNNYEAVNVHEDVSNLSRKKRTAMLDLLILAEKNGLIEDFGIQEEVDTFMFEGHDTTASGLTFCLMMLANNKQIQDKIVAELNAIFHDDDRRTTIEDLSLMRYLENCIKESLRLYPPVPFISRIISETVQLSNYEVPEGTFCNIHIFDLHRREDLFPNALKFDPDRFLPENSVGRHPYSYIPFSAGPRNCIGQKFALLEMKSTISAILRRYELDPVTRPSDIQIPSDLVLRNNGPVYVTFKRRK